MLYRNSGAAMDAALADTVEEAFNAVLHQIDPDFDRVDDEKLTEAIDAILGPDK